MLPTLGFAQETGVAAKAPSVDMSQNGPQTKTSATARRFQPVHKRLQNEPRNLPVNNKSGTTTRSALPGPQTIASVQPQTLPEMSPSPASSFVALPDNGEVVPPDTSGAVGPSHLVVACASEIRISDRFGNVISTRSQELFWTNVARNIFDTRVVYDPYGNRFIMTAAGDPAGTNPRLCIAVSASSNPTGTWYRWSEDVDATFPIYADSPTVGFNKTWIVVQANMYNKSTFVFSNSFVYAYNKANLYANGTGQRTRLVFDRDLGGSQVPATMYDSANAFVYFVKDWNGNVTNEVDGETDGFLRLFSLAGGVGTERLVTTNTGGGPIYAFVGRTWAESPSNDVDILPQLGTTNNIYAGDSRIQNVHFRDGLLYATHTVFTPAAAPTRAAVQWWVITATADPFVQLFGRVEDEGGTNMFAYPSISANRYQDVLIGYSRFSPQEYPSAAYSFRRGDDPTDELRGEVRLKTGEAFYYEPIGTQNRWGDWSATTVDPVNDVDLWTIQQYAAPQVGGQARWGTWWGQVSPPVDLGLTMSDAPDPVPSGTQFTYTLRVTNKEDAVISGVRVLDTLPTGVSYVSHTTSQGSCGHTNGVVSCALGSMTELASAVITITVTAGLPSFVTNSATVLANGPDFDTVDNTAVTATEIFNSADLQVLGTDNPDPVHQGNTLTYTLTITNRGPSPAAGVVMTSALPASVSIGTINGPGTWSINGNVISFTLGSINSGANAVITIGCTPSVGGMITNQVVVGANTFDTVLGNNTTNIVTRVNARPVINQIPRQTINEDAATPISITISDAETAAGSLQLTASSSNQGLIPNGNIVRGGTGQSRTLTITPAPNQFGSNTTTITVTVTDAEGASNTMSFPIDVANVNDPPTISNVISPAPIDEDTSAEVTFTIGDIDTPISALTLSGESSAPGLLPNENIQFSPSGTTRIVTVTPAQDKHGTALVTVRVSDGSLSASDPFNLTVRPVNDPPTTSGIGPQFTLEDTATTNIQFTVTDVETADINLVVLATSDNQILVPNSNIVRSNAGTLRTIRLTPAPDQHGLANITVSISDGTNTIFTAFPLTVSQVNDPPTLTPQPSVVTTNEDTGPVTVALTGIGPGAANESQPVTIQASTTRPDLVQNLQVNYTNPNPSGTLTFSLPPDVNGTAFVDLVVSDGTAADNVTRQVQVTVNAVNDRPTINDIGDVNVPEDSGQRSITLTGISSGPPNESDQTNLITADSSAPSIVPDPQIVYTPGDSTALLRFTPMANATGTVTITVTLNDGRTPNGTVTDTFRITVDSINDNPTMAPHLGNRTIDEDTSTGVIAFNFRDVEPGPLTIEGFSSNQTLVPNGNVAITGTGTNRNLNVTPVGNEFGTALITVRISDTEGGFTNQTFELTVRSVNDPPTLAAIPNPPPIQEDALEQTVNLSGITPGPSNESTQQVRVTAISSNPSIVPHPAVDYTFPNQTALLRYTPVLNATGSVVITVTADDRESANNLATRTFTVQVNPVNDPPTIDGDFEDKFTDEDIAASFTFTIGDVETPVANLNLEGSSSNDEVVADTGITFSGSGATRTITVRPLTNEWGNSLITITVTDGGNAVAEAFFVLNVNEVNDPPMIATVPVTINEDNVASTNFWVNDADSDVSGLTVVGTSSNQQIVPDANIVIAPGSGTNRTIQVTPLPDANGQVTISVRADDGNSNRTSQFTLTVNSINDRPTLDDIPNQNLIEDSGQQLLTLSGVGPGAANETSDVLSVSAVSSLTSVIPHPVATNDNGVWKLRYTPVANASGSANVTVTVNDGRPVNPTISKSFTVNVISSNDPPTLNSISDRTLNEDVGVTNIPLAGISAGGGENQTLSFTASSSFPALVQPNVLYTNGNSTGVLRLTVAPNSTGNATITVRLSDGINETVRTFLVGVLEVNEPPVITGLINVTTMEDVPVSVPFTIRDEETYAARLTLSATSTNLTLVPNTNIVFHGSESNRFVTITPATNLSGPTRITITVSDGTNNVSSSFNLTVTATNDPPTLNPLPNVAFTENPQTTNISLSGITSGASNEGQTLSVRVASSNPSLVPAPSSVTYSSPNTTGSFSLNPANNGTGSSVITVTVWDSGPPSNSVSRSFTVYIRPPGNSLPTISSLSNRGTLEDTPVTVNFTIGDSSTPVGSLGVGAFSTNPDLFPTNAFAFSGTTANRSVTISPAAERSGAATVTVWVTDSESGYNASSFTLTVTNVNDLPTISSISNQTIDRGTNMPPVPFSVSDVETPAENLSFGIVSSNQGLLPNSNVFLGGAGTNRSVIAYPVAGQTGSSMITITVTDGNGASANRAFTLTVRSPQPPSLAIRRAGPNVDLLWPLEAGLFTVQGRDQVNTGTWVDIIATPGVSGTNYVVPQAISGPHKFYRLRN